MQPHIENEVKWALDAVGHGRLAAELPRLLGPGCPLPQRNRFCDSADGRLRAAGLNLRLRLEGSRLVLTCKRRGAATADGLHRHDEWETGLDPGLFPALAGGAPFAAEALPLPEALRDALAGAALVCLGGFDNDRLEWRDGDALLCLDATSLPGRTDYELEIESAQAGEAAARWAPRLSAWDVVFRPQLKTKFARWLALVADRA